MFNCSRTPNRHSAVGKAALDLVNRIHVDCINPSSIGTGIEKQDGLVEPQGQSITAPVSSI